MKNIAKKKINNFIKSTFKSVGKKQIYRKIKKRHLTFRVALSLIFFAIFLIATILIPPLPFGNISLILALIIIFPINTVKSKILYWMNKTRLPKLYAMYLQHKHRKKSEAAKKK